MKTARCELSSVSPYSQSAPTRSERKGQEPFDEFEERVWRERIHSDENGLTFIPAMAFKKALSAAAGYVGEKVKGKRGATFLKYFKSGLVIIENVTLQIKAKDVEGEWLFVPSDGKPGGGSRVWKRFPVIREWQGVLTVCVIDDTIDNQTFANHLTAAGAFIGVGRFRPERDGFYGRFEVKKITWS